MNIKDIPSDIKNFVGQWFNFNYFEENQKEFREINIDFIKSVLMNFLSGLIDVTCGVGKTCMQALACAAVMTKYGSKTRICISSPRLLLNSQLYEQYCKMLNVNKNNVETYWLCSQCPKSEKSSLKEIGKRVKSVQEFEEITKNTNKTCILFTTQTSIHIHEKSFPKINNLFDLLIVDECHKILGRTTFENVKSSAKQFLLFSATSSKDQKKNVGVIFKFSFKQALDCGYVCKPHLWTLALKDDQKNIDQRSYSKRLNLSKNLCLNAILHDINRSPISTTLVYNEDISSTEYCTLFLVENLNKLHKKTTIYQFTSTKLTEEGEIIGSCKVFHNGKTEYVQYSKVNLLEILKDDDSNHKIILNAQMLTEGIDLPDITGVVILCKKNDAALYQALMRGCRVSKNKCYYNVYCPEYFLEEELADKVNSFILKLLEKTEGEIEFPGEIGDGGHQIKKNKQGYAKPDTKPSIVDILVKLKNEYLDEQQIEKTNIEKRIIEIIESHPGLNTDIIHSVEYGIRENTLKWLCEFHNELNEYEYFKKLKEILNIN